MVGILIGRTKKTGLHPLLMEALVHVDQRAKLEDYDSDLFLILKMLHFDEEAMMALKRPLDWMKETLSNCLPIPFNV